MKIKHEYIEGSIVGAIIAIIMSLAKIDIFTLSGLLVFLVVIVVAAFIGVSIERRYGKSIIEIVRSLFKK